MFAPDGYDGGEFYAEWLYRFLFSIHLFIFIIEVMVVGCRSCGDERCCDCKINKYLYEYCNDLKLA